MNYKKRLDEMNDAELTVCITSLFRAQNAQQRTRDQNVSLITSWLHAMTLTSKHQFLFYKDETGEIWLLNRDQINCICCRGSPPKQSRKTQSPKIEKNGQVTCITIQPGSRMHSTSTSRQPSPNLARRQIPNRPEKRQNFCYQCCAECSNICSNLFS